MTLALMLPLLLSPPAGGGTVVGQVDEPPIQIWLNQDGSYQHNDRAQVFVRMAEDGYLVVLRNDADGHVQVLFPVHPADNNFLQGATTLEIRGGGDRETFSIDERTGTGVVLAARSATPFRFDDFVQGDQWDVIAFDTLPARSDKEAVLLDVARQMSADSHFDHADVSYSVGAESASYDGWSPQFGAPIFFVSGFAFGRPACLDPFFDPLFCDPFRFGPFFHPICFRSLLCDPFFAPVIIQNNIVIIFRDHGFTFASPFSNQGRVGFRRPFAFKDPVPIESGVSARPRLRIPPTAAIDRAEKTTATGGPRLVRVIQLGVVPAPPQVRNREGGSTHTLTPVQGRGRIQPTAAAPVSTRVPARTSGRVPWPVRVPWPIRLDDRGAAAASDRVRGRESTPGRGATAPVRECVGCVIPNVRILGPTEMGQRGFAVPSTEGAGRGGPAPRSTGSARGVTSRGWGGGRRP